MEKNILEGNKLIADFDDNLKYRPIKAGYELGGSYVSISRTFDTLQECLDFCDTRNYGMHPDECFFPLPYSERFELRYDSSWDWLIPPMKKIKNYLQNIERPSRNYCCKGDMLEVDVQCHLWELDIEKTFKSFVILLEWYNKQQMLTTKKEKMNTEEEVNKGLYLYDAIAGDLEEMKSEAECEEYVRDNYMEDGEVHIDIESIIFLKKVGGVIVTETGGTTELNGEEVPNVKVEFEWQQSQSADVAESITVKSAKINRETKQGEFLIEVGDKDEEIKMSEALEIVKDLAVWSIKYPRGGIYSMNSKMDEQLIAIEERAKIYYQALNPKG